MSESKKKLINPFELAKLAAGVHTRIDTRDVRSMQPDMTEASARVFLAEHKHQIAYAMLFAGTQAIRALLPKADAN